MQSAWIDALPPPRKFTVQGYLHKRRVGARKLGSDFDLRCAFASMPSPYHIPWCHVPCPPHTTSPGATWHAPSSPHLPRCHVSLVSYAVYDVISGFFAYYENEQEALLDMKPRGAARVVSAVLRPTAKIPHLFSFFSDDGMTLHDLP